MLKKALIPAAGRGARLDRPNTPKPLVTVGGNPLLMGVLKQLETAGVEETVVVVGYEGKKIVRALTNHPELEMTVTFVDHKNWEEGLASSILAGRDHLDDEPFALAMADHVYDQELIERLFAEEFGDELGVMVVDRDIKGVYDR